MLTTMETQTDWGHVVDGLRRAKEFSDLLRPKLPEGWSYTVPDDERIVFCHVEVDECTLETRCDRTIVLTLGIPTSCETTSRTSFRLMDVKKSPNCNGPGTERRLTNYEIIANNFSDLFELMKPESPGQVTAFTKERIEKKEKPISKKRRDRYRAEGHPIGRKFSSSLKCKFCSETFVFENAFVKFGHHETLLFHSRTHRNQTVPKRGRFKCSQCDKIFTFEYLLNQHQKKKHDPKNYKPNKTDRGEFSCKLCDKVLSQLRHLERHVQLVHNSEPNHRPFVCEICGKAFKTKFNLSKHHKTHQERPFKCNQCGAAFCAKCELEYHKIIHTGEKPFLCQQCGKGFSTKTYLHQHQVKVCKVKVRNVGTPTKAVNKSVEELSSTNMPRPKSSMEHPTILATSVESYAGIEPHDENAQQRSEDSRLTNSSSPLWTPSKLESETYSLPQPLQSTTLIVSRDNQSHAETIPIAPVSSENPPLLFCVTPVQTLSTSVTTEISRPLSFFTPQQQDYRIFNS